MAKPGRVRHMSVFCDHPNCLERELRALVSLEVEVWRRASRGGPSYVTGMAFMANGFAHGAVRREF